MIFRRSIFILSAVLAGLLLILQCKTFGASAEGERLERMQASSQWQEDKFVNEADLPEGPGFFSVAIDWLTSTDDVETEPENGVVFEKRTAEEFMDDPAGGMRITWFGHSTILAELQGIKILFDPVWSERVSPVSFIGPKRFHEPPMSLEELVKIPVDAVVISHDHYDHLDYGTIVALNKTNCKFIVPLGVGAHLEYWGVEKDRIIELDWWQNVEIKGVTFTATPSQHFSGRTLEDRDETLWASWAVNGPEKSIYYSGDTGYFDGFKEIGNKLGPFDVGIMAIGAYNELWAPIHLNPEEAIQAHIDVGAKQFIPVHWGTFNLAFHSWTEPIERTIRAAEENHIAVFTPMPGSSVSPPAMVAMQRWWDDRVKKLARKQ